MKTIKKSLLAFFFFLIPTIVFLYFKSNVFDGWKTNVFYFLIIFLTVALIKLPKWRLVTLVAIALITMIAWKIIDAYGQIYFRLYMASGAFLITITITWLYKQYRQPGKKNLVGNIFGFQICFGFFGWLLAYLFMPSSWMLWVMLGFMFLGGVIACYDYGECKDETIYD